MRARVPTWLACLAILLCLAQPPVHGASGSDTITTIAGTGADGSSGDGGSAIAATLWPYSVAVDGSGVVYVLDVRASQDNSRRNGVIRKIGTDGTISAYAGMGVVGYAGDGGPATQAQFNLPWGLAVDGRGNLHISDSFNNRVRRIDAATGIITTFAGTGTGGFSGDGGPATQAQLNGPRGIAFGPDGSLFIADAFNYRVRRVAPDGTISTIAGNGLQTIPAQGVNGPTLAASLGIPQEVAVDGDGLVYIGDVANARVFRVGPDGILRLHAGGGLITPEGGSPQQTEIRYIGGLAVDTSKNLYYADASDNRVRAVVRADGSVHTVAGTGMRGFGGDAGRADAAVLNSPSGFAIDVLGNVYLADTGNRRVRKVSAPVLAADLAVTKTCTPAPAMPGSDITCTVTVTNRGPGGAMSVTLSDVASGVTGLTVQSIQVSRGSCASAVAGIVTCSLGSLAPSENATATVVLRGAPNAGGTLSNVATVASPQADAVPGNNTVTVQVPVGTGTSDLAITQQARVNSVTVGRVLAFILHAVNNGPDPALAPQVIALPAGQADVQGIASPQGTCSSPMAIPLTCTLSSLPNGATATIGLRVVPRMPGQYCSNASISGTGTDPVPANNAAVQACVEVVPQVPVNAFVALGTTLLSLGPRSSVESGALGTVERAATSIQEVSIRGPVFFAPGTFVLGDTVRLDRARVPEVRANELQAANGGDAGVESAPGSFPALALPAFTAAQPGTLPSDDVTVAANQTRTLPFGRYRNVLVEAGATLVLQGYTYATPAFPPVPPPAYDFLNLTVRAGGKVLFSEPVAGEARLGATVRITHWLQADRTVTIGPASAAPALRASQIIFYVGGLNTVDATPQLNRFPVFIGPNSTVQANFYAPNGSIVLHRGTRAKGAFIGRQFLGDAVRLTLDSAF